MFGAVAYAFGLGACNVDGGGALVTDCLPRVPGHRYYGLTVGVRLALAGTMVQLRVLFAAAKVFGFQFQCFAGALPKQ